MGIHESLVVVRRGQATGEASLRIRGAACNWAGIEHCRRHAVETRYTEIFLDGWLRVDVMLVGEAEVTSECKGMVSVRPGHVVGEIPDRIVARLRKNAGARRNWRCECRRPIDKG